MSHRGNCHDNVLAESSSQHLKRERIKLKIYNSRQDANSDVFDYMDMFHTVNPRRGFNNQLPPVEFEKRCVLSLQGVENPVRFNTLLKALKTLRAPEPPHAK